LNALGRKQWQSTKWIALLKTVEKPYKITVSSDDAAGSSDGLDFVVVVLKEKHPFLLRQKGYGDRFTSTRRNSYTGTERGL
jgi:hypothetical protein